MSRTPVHPRPMVAGLVSLLLLGSVACTDAVEGSDDAAIVDVEPQPAALGELLRGGDGIEVVVRSIESYDRSVDAFPRIRLVVRSENTGDHDSTNPQIGLRCEESSEPGEWHLGSTWEAAGFLPEGAFGEGELLLAFPSKEGDRFYPLASCTDARVRVIIGEGDENVEVFEIPVEESIIDRALTRPLGPRFPLPTIVG